MYKFFKRLGLVILVLASFIYTEKATLTVKEYDNLMIEIKENKDNYKKEKKEAIINGDTIIPGIAGRIVDIDKSYSNMRMNSKYDPSLLNFKLDYPRSRLKDNKDKYIIKTQKEEVALIVRINKYFDESLLNNNITFYMDNSFIKNNKELVTKLIYNKYTILNNQNDYLKNVMGVKNTYCMTEEKDIELLKKCSKNSYTIIPNIIIKNNYYKLNSELSKGSIILANLNNYQSALKIIKNKGYKIVSIDELLSE